MEFNNANISLVVASNKYHVVLREFSYEQIAKEKAEKDMLEIRT